MKLLIPFRLPTLGALVAGLILDPGGSSAASIADIFRQQSPAVVMVAVFDSHDKLLSFGSGFVVNPNGIIVTNYHVVEDASLILVRLPSREILENAALVYHEKDRDLAILSAKRPGLPTVQLGDSDAVEVGEEVIAIGNPQGLENTVTKGIVSGRWRLRGRDYIQTDVTISGGSSGGPLLNTKGEVIGVTVSFLRESENLNFSIPINDVKRALEMVELDTRRQHRARHQWELKVVWERQARLQAEAEFAQAREARRRAESELSRERELRQRAEAEVARLRASMRGSKRSMPQQPKPSPPSIGGTQPRDVYQAVYIDFSEGNYQMAIAGFREFGRRFPESDLADNAQYWIGEAYFSLAHGYAAQEQPDKVGAALKQAVQEFRKVTVNYPWADKVPTALYKEAFALLELEEPSLAEARLKYLLEYFPLSPEAPLARDRLNALQ